jgi:hypothetical protein
MTAQTKGVDVLAVLDEAETYVSDPSWSPSMVRELREARAAIAELIEAARRANGDHCAPHDCYATGPLTGDPYRDLVECPGCALAAALARCGGAQ